MLTESLQSLHVLFVVVSCVQLVDKKKTEKKSKVCSKGTARELTGMLLFYFFLQLHVMFGV